MKILRYIALALVPLAVIVCSWVLPVDDRAMSNIDSGLKGALVTFASARALSGVLSVIQAAQLDIQPAGIGVTLSPGQLLAPVNELVKHFADWMLLACIAFGIQKILVSISGYWSISIALSIVALVWAAFQFKKIEVPKWFSKLFLIMLMLRFAIPLAIVGTDILSQQFLSKDYATAQAAIDMTTKKANEVKGPEPSESGASGWIPKLPGWVPNIADIQTRYIKLKDTVENSTEHMIKLIVVFLMQTLLLPLLLISILFWIFRGVVNPKNRAV
jgi:hypothetical protein